MGTITTGVGLVSGLNIQELVGKLIDLESGASKQLEARIETKTQIQSAYQTLSLRIVGANLTASKLGKAGAFADRSASASSDAVTVSAGKGATLGSFQFTPRRLVSTNQLLSTGFTTDTTTISSTATTIKIAQGGFVDEGPALSSLNGGAGVRVGSIKITDQAGGSSIVDLTGATTAKDVIDTINASTGANIRAWSSGDRFVLSDLSGGPGALTVSEVGGGNTAKDLGLDSLISISGMYGGRDIYDLSSSLSLDVLRDGNGVRNGVGNDFSITVGSLSFNVDISGARTVGDVLNAINSNAGNTGGRVLASIDQDRLEIRDTAATDSVVVAALGGSQTASDLGLLNGTGGGGVLTGNEVLGSLNSVLLTTLKGGAAAAPTVGTITINGSNVDLSNATSLSDVIDGINFAGISGVSASFNAAGNGISIRRVGAGGLTISDTSGNLASYLGISGTTAGSDVTRNSGDLNRQYVSENTRLSTYGGAAGVPKGKFRVTDGNGQSAVVDLTQESDDTIGDVIRELNTRGLAISARINDTGDGILIEKTAGSQALSVSEVDGGTTAKALGLLKTPNGSGAIDGTLEVSISVTSTTTLRDMVTKLREAGAPVSASVINDGSALNPFRLNVTSNRSGLAGRLMIDTGASTLNFSTVSQAQDAVLLYGGTGPGVVPVQVTSNSNTFSGLVPGVSVSAKKVSNEPVTVTVGENRQGVVDAVQAFVDDYNELRDYLKEKNSYNADTDERGLLFTDPTTRQVERQLVNFINSTFSNTGSNIKNLGALGVKLEGDGKLSFNSRDLEDAMSDDIDSVARFFNTTGTGVVARFQTLTNTLTRVGDGVLDARMKSLSSELVRQQSTLEDQNERLKLKEERLYKQFYAMEQALSAFQSQQTALTQLSSLASSFRRR